MVTEICQLLSRFWVLHLTMWNCLFCFVCILDLPVPINCMAKNWSLGLQLCHKLHSTQTAMTTHQSTEHMHIRSTKLENLNCQNSYNQTRQTYGSFQSTHVRWSVQLIEPWRPKHAKNEDKTLLQCSQCSHKGEFWHVSIIRSDHTLEQWWTMGRQKSS